MGADDHADPEHAGPDHAGGLHRVELAVPGSDLDAAGSRLTGRGGRPATVS